MHQSKLTLICLALLGIAIASGCGSDQLPTHIVEGKVKFSDGTHPMFGTIEFHSAEHKVNARGTIKLDGSFTVGTYEPDDGAVEGAHKIVIVQIVSEPVSALSKAKAEIIHNHGEVVSSKYIDYRTSGLTCDIKSGVNKVELVVEKSPDQ